MLNFLFDPDAIRLVRHGVILSETLLSRVGKAFMHAHALDFDRNIITPHSVARVQS